MRRTHQVSIDRNAKQHAVSHHQLLPVIQLHVVEVEEQIARRLHLPDRSDAAVVLLNPLHAAQNVALRKRRRVVRVIVHSLLSGVQLTQDLLAVQRGVQRQADRWSARTRSRTRLARGVEDDGRRGTGTDVTRAVDAAVTGARNAGSCRTRRGATLENRIDEKGERRIRLLLETSYFAYRIYSPFFFNWRGFRSISKRLGRATKNCILGAESSLSATFTVCMR